MSIKTIAGSTLLAVAAITVTAGGASAAPATNGGGIALQPVADDTAAQDVAYLTLSSPHSRNIEEGAGLGGASGVLVGGVSGTLGPALLPGISSTLGPVAMMGMGSASVLPLVLPIGSVVIGAGIGGAISASIPASDVPDGLEWHGTCDDYGNCY